MTANAGTTVRYRLLCRPELGPTLGNTVYVRLPVDYEDQLARPAFEGLPRRIAEIKDAMKGTPLLRMGSFDADDMITAVNLDYVMRSRYLAQHQPVLMDGAEVFGREEPIDRCLYTLGLLAESFAFLLAVELDSSWECDPHVDVTRGQLIAHSMRVWKAWREVRSVDELVRELATHLPAALAEQANGKTEGLVRWPRDADRIEELVRITADAFERHTEPHALFEDLKQLAARPGRS